MRVLQRVSTEAEQYEVPRQLSYIVSGADMYAIYATDKTHVNDRPKNEHKKAQDKDLENHQIEDA